MDSGWGVFAQGAADCARQLAGWADVRWDPTGSAEGMGTLAALLAGFAVSGLVWVAAADRMELPDPPVGVMGLWGAIVPLVLATLLFAEVSGEAACDRAMVGTTVASTLLTIGTVSVVIALGHLLAQRFGEAITRLFVTITVTAVFLGTASTLLGNATMIRALGLSGWFEAVLWQLVGLVAASVAGMALGSASAKGASAYAAVFLGAVAFVLYYVTAFWTDNPEGWMAYVVSWGRAVTWGVYAGLTITDFRSRAPYASDNHEVEGVSRSRDSQTTGLGSPSGPR